ncbi:c6 zinc finger domain-containing protein [Diplodia corticola]|uniref:C6 zinc finger domain-containing protein n=1 Tax=Diplodia corticola TaxID=236234 RepID=A0A1J9QXR4_9PEZI|nr:c6 zinc finger domain-containing protein [Diplodia corticola]OJD33161.1 c6 zinc finger domain-containing protein [Diplodia corticola]
MATEHAAPAFSVPNYHHFQQPPHFAKQSQGVFVASTRLNCPAMDLPSRDPAQLPNSIQVHARRKSVPYTGSFRRSHTTGDMSTADYAAHDFAPQKKPSPPPSLADSACSVCTTRHWECDGKRPQCTGCERNGLSCHFSEAPSSPSSDRSASQGMSADDFVEVGDLPQEVEPHRELIEGVRRVYATLVKMRYIPAEELIWPPHHQLKSTLEPLGFDPRIVDLLRYLPYLRNTVVQRASPELDHGTYGINYLDQGEAEDMLEVSRPNEVFIFKSCSDFGNFYVYDMDRKTMKLATPFQLYSKEAGRQEFDNRLTARSAGLVLNDLVEGYRNLTLVPMRGLHGYQLSSSLPGSDTEIKRLYLRHGWPNKFDGESFQKALSEWLERESQKQHADVGQMTRVSAVEAQSGTPNRKTMRSTRSLRERLHLTRRATANR